MPQQHSLRSVLVVLSILTVLTVTQATVGICVLRGSMACPTIAPQILPVESNFYVIDPRDSGGLEGLVVGSATLIGPIGFDNVDGLAFLGDGRLVGAFRADSLVADPESPGTPVRASGLIEIDPSTGAGTFIGLIGDSLTGCGRVTDLAYDPATDTLYGLAESCVDDDEALVVIDQETGAGLSVGATGFRNGGGLAIDPDSGVLHATAIRSNMPFLDVILFTVDPSTGAATVEHQLGPWVIDSLDFGPDDGVLHGLVRTGWDLFPSVLVAINLEDQIEEERTMGVAVFEVDHLDGLVFGPAPPPTLEVPTLGQWGLVLLVGLIVLVGLVNLRVSRH